MWCLTKISVWKSMLLIGILPTAFTFTIYSRSFSPLKRLLIEKHLTICHVCVNAVRNTFKRISLLCSSSSILSESTIDDLTSLQLALENILLSDKFKVVDYYNNPAGLALAQKSEGNHWNSSKDDYSWTAHLRCGLPRRPYTKFLAGKLLDVSRTSKWPRRETVSGFNETDEAEAEREWIQAIENCIGGLQRRAQDLTGHDHDYQTLQHMTAKLGLRGLLSLMGLRCTTGSVLCVPPDLPTLIAAFQTPHTRGGKLCTLTVGGRALSKHAIRSKDGWWGSIGGNDKAKNARALQVLLRIFEEAVWINTHMLREGFRVVEIRTVEGYGARWTADGESFRGFLEPQMDNGHDLHWRH